MKPNNKPAIRHPFRRLLFLCVGLIIMAFGVAFSIKADLGTSPISSVPYVTSAISGLSVGTATILINALFILLQIIILRRQYEWFQLLQFPAVTLFGFAIDFAGIVLADIPVVNYAEQWLLCAIGIFVLALGVSIEVSAGLVTIPGEGLVLAVCKVAPIKFSSMKVVLDVSLVCISVVLSLAFLGKLEGVREGSIAAAVCVGLITRQTGKLTGRAAAALF